MINEQLIQQAYNTPCIDWQDIDSLIHQATDDATRERLRTIRNMKYHQEEYHSCCL